MNDVPVTGKAIIDTVSKALLWLDRQIELLAGPPQQRAAPALPDMTDVQLHHAIHDIGATLLNRHGRFLQGSFARYGATMGDPRFPAAMPATVRSHVLMMIVQANDSYGLACLACANMPRRPRWGRYGTSRRPMCMRSGCWKVRRRRSGSAAPTGSP
jgi:hypothetical protein